MCLAYMLFDIEMPLTKFNSFTKFIRPTIPHSTFNASNQEKSSFSKYIPSQLLALLRMLHSHHQSLNVHQVRERQNELHYRGSRRRGTS